MAIGYIYEAFDKVLQKNVALKIEKKDKNKSILIFEYNVINMLKGRPQDLTRDLGLTHVCNAHDFVKNSEQNLIVMDLLGNNLSLLPFREQFGQGSQVPGRELQHLDCHQAHGTVSSSTHLA